MSVFIYNKYSDFLANKYGVKTYKLPVNIPVTCPNRDGNISTGGCSYCAPAGAGFECLDSSVSVKDQLSKNRCHIAAKYKASKFIAYFQNYSNTYLPFADFENYILDAAESDICELAVSTRPDSLMDKHITFLKETGEAFNIGITIELGLQTANYHTLLKINRGHTLAEYIDACLRIKNISKKIEICTHVILNLPSDSLTDVIETAKIISVLGIHHVKLHALYIMEGTEMADDYLNNRFAVISPGEYIQRAIAFIEHLSPNITLQRLIGRAPEEGAVFVNWGMSWRKVQNEIERIMKENRHYQGRLYNYAGGSAFNDKPEYR